MQLPEYQKTFTFGIFTAENFTPVNFILAEVGVAYTSVTMCEHTIDSIKCNDNQRIFLDIESIQYRFKEGDSCNNAAGVVCTLKTSYVVNKLLSL